MATKIRIIIADDHLVFIDGIEALLKEFESIAVIGHAENGQQLIEQVSLHKPDIVLTDIQMPVMDGIEATKEIHKRFPEIKVIALTMLKESLFIKRMQTAGACAYVLKTVDKEELVKAIQKVAAGEKYFSAEILAQLSNEPTHNITEVLTKREKEILVMIAQGLTDKEIAEKVFLSPLTVITHRKNILIKLGLKNKVELTRYAISNDLLQ
jgi:DNA-binding NarL/FixJ family response regulator